MSTLLTENDSNLLMNQARENLYYEQAEKMRPSMMLLHHLRISMDGNQWCVLYGENLQDGVAGFGDSPDAAMRDLDAAWITSLGEKVVR